MLYLLVRFLIGGAMVTLFSQLADLLKPKSFAGLFGAAPSVALATLGLTISAEGKSFAAIEARSMIVGAVGFLLYAYACSYFMMKLRVRVIVATTSLLTLWLVFSAGVWLLALR